MSDRIAVVNEGRIAQLGRPEELYDRPCNRFVASFIGESNFLAGVVRGTQAGMVVVECDGAMLHAVATAPLPPGTEVTLTIRPERLRFADGMLPAAGQQNRLRATVTEAMFAGERCRYLLRREDGETIVLKEPSGAGSRRRQVGEAAELTWSPADTVVV